MSKIDLNAQEILIVVSWLTAGFVIDFMGIDISQPQVYWRLIGMLVCTVIVFGANRIRI